MSSEFATYEQAFDHAVEQSNKIGVAHGIEKPTLYQKWTVKMLPRKENRCGWELRCEAVEPGTPKRAVSTS